MMQSLSTRDVNRDRLVSLFASVAPFKLPLINAIVTGKIKHLAEVKTNPSRADMRELLGTLPSFGQEPTVVVIGEDDGTDTAPGPSAYPKLRQLLDWAAVIVLHSTGGHQLHYAAVVAAAVAKHRVVLIETTTKQHDAWLAVLPEDTPMLAICVPPGDPSHPTLPVRH